MGVYILLLPVILLEIEGFYLKSFSLKVKDSVLIQGVIKDCMNAVKS